MRAGPLLKPYQKNKVEHTAYFYPEVNHTTILIPDTMMQPQLLSWTRTIDFFKEKLKQQYFDI
jgi:carboxymethylenebutenolidase